MSKTFYVYIYSDPKKNNEAIYVGKGTGRRSHYHLSRTDDHPLTHRIKQMRDMGYEPDITIEKCGSSDMAYELEKMAIIEIGRAITGDGTLLNLQEPGKGIKGMLGKSHTPDARKAMSDKHTGRKKSLTTRRRMSAAQHNRSPELLKQIAESNTGIKHKLKQKTCPHCGLTGSGPNMTRCHFDNCKCKNILAF